MTDALTQLTAALADRYRVERELGAGGMAVVYLAHDLKHDRKVAVKVLRPELAAAIGADRFLREIQITARLNHAHILPLLDSGSVEEQPSALLYYVMPYVEGESLRDRMNRETRIPVDDALALASEVADALGLAHRQGLIHRDIKPENILLREGHAVMADFGIALAITAAHGDRLTETGLSLGTPTYMSPEQIEGVSIDGRSDIYALGCLMFEITTGQAPFDAPTPLAVAIKHQTEPAPDPRTITDEISEDVAQLILRCLEKEPEKRYETATHLLKEIERIRHPAAEPAGVFNVGELLRHLRRPIVAAPTVLAIVAFAWLSVWFFQHRADVRWAREVAIPEIERMIGENDAWRNLVEPYRLAEQAEAILGDDPELAELMSRVSLKVDVRTDPPGADVFMKEYGHPDDEWTFVGVSPVEDLRLPYGFFRWKLEKEGFETVIAAASSWNFAVAVGGDPGTLLPYEVVRTLDPLGSLPAGMVRVQAARTPVGEIGDFFVDRYEVTNRQYKEFVDAGGYRSPEYWEQPFSTDGGEFTFEEAMQVFVDPSQQSGPATWLGGDYPQGQAEYPVSGVSWYEAAAYAEFVGKSLPTRFHWLMAAGYFTPMIGMFQLGGTAILAPFANFGGEGPVEVGSLPSLTPYGALDMPGNVREWCWNETPSGRLIRGGGYDDNTYMFRRRGQADPWDRSARNGIRLALYPDSQSTPATAFQLDLFPSTANFSEYEPVDDAVFQVYKEQFSYDETDLNAHVEASAESEGGWTREKVSFDAAYGDERVLAHLFLPANATPPYQTVIYFPGSASALMQSSEDIEAYHEFPMFVSFLVRNGRAVLYPVYKGTFERSRPELTAIHYGNESRAFTGFLRQIVMDFKRSVDYLETRDDIDSDMLAYYGMSWGGWFGSVIPAVEDRLRASVLVAGHMNPRGRPEANALSYVSRVTIPTLMLNGKHDVFADAEIRPMIELLGTPEEHKRLILYDTDHVPPRAEYIKETLSWLDKYLGPVER